MVEKLYVIAVAPHTGAWIETPCTFPAYEQTSVAPHTGAWIETNCDISVCDTGIRRSPYGSVD